MGDSSPVLSIPLFHCCCSLPCCSLPCCSLPKGDRHRCCRPRKQQSLKSLYYHSVIRELPHTHHFVRDKIEDPDEAVGDGNNAASCPLVSPASKNGSGRGFPHTVQGRNLHAPAWAAESRSAI